MPAPDILLAVIALILAVLALIPWPPERPVGHYAVTVAVILVAIALLVP